MPLELVLELGGAGEHTPVSGQRGVWEEVKTMANVLNLQTDVVEVTQETKCFSHWVSRWICRR